MKVKSRKSKEIRTKKQRTKEQRKKNNEAERLEFATDGYIQERARQASKEDFLKTLSQVSDFEADEYDQL